MGFLVAAMTPPNVLTRLRPYLTVIAPGDRTDALPALILAHQSATFPDLASVVLTGGYVPPEPIARLIDGIKPDVPILITDGGTFETATTLGGVQGRLTADSPVKLERSLQAVRRGSRRGRDRGRAGRRRSERGHPDDVPVPADRAGPDGPPARRAARG